MSSDPTGLISVACRENSTGTPLVCLQALEGGFLAGHSSLGVRTLESKSVRLENTTETAHLDRM